MKKIRIKQFKLKGLRGARPLRGAKAQKPGTGLKGLKVKRPRHSQYP